MKDQFYINTVEKLKNRQNLAAFIVLLGKVSTLLIYIIYTAFLIFLALTKNTKLLPAVIVPAVGFLLVSILRCFLNLPRPYQIIDQLIPLYPKKTVGKSFPSRHTFSAFVIATTVSVIFPILGCFLFVVATLLAVCRVLSGVHFVRDVVVGAVLGVIIGLFVNFF